MKILRATLLNSVAGRFLSRRINVSGRARKILAGIGGTCFAEWVNRKSIWEIQGQDDESAVPGIVILKKINIVA